MVSPLYILIRSESFVCQVKVSQSCQFLHGQNKIFKEFKYIFGTLQIHVSFSQVLSRGDINVGGFIGGGPLGRDIVGVVVFIG